MPVSIDRSITVTITADADGASTANLQLTRQQARALRDAAVKLVRNRFPTWSAGITDRIALEKERRHQMMIAVRQIVAQVQAGTVVLR